MNQTILNLEKRRNRILSKRNDFKYKADKEDVSFKTILGKFDRLLIKIASVIKSEWNKKYIRK